MNTYTLDEIVDEVVGVKGTPRRDALEAEVQASLIGEAIRQSRKEKNLTQEQLGKLLGIGRSQVARIESGKNLTLQTIIRVFRAMGVPANLSLGGYEVSLV